jgi:DNA-binding transcriptional LysR family regulator
MDRFQVLRLFVAVGEQASFAEAARRLRVSPTAASRAIATLERELGATLLHRTTRSVVLTDAGARYHEHCRRALDELDDAARGLRGEDAEPRGTLVLTAPEMFGRLHILPVVTTLLRTYPALDVRLTLNDRVVRLVEEGIDVAVRIAELPDSSLRAARVAETRRVLVASPAYVAASGTPQRLTDLYDHALIAVETLAPNGEWRFDGPGRPTIRVEPRLLTNSMGAAIDAARAGLGITRALCYQVRAEVDRGELVMLLRDHEPPAVPISLLYAPNRQRSANVRAFIDATKTALSGLG